MPQLHRPAPRAISHLLVGLAALRMLSAACCKAPPLPGAQGRCRPTGPRQACQMQSHMLWPMAALMGRPAHTGGMGSRPPDSLLRPTPHRCAREPSIRPQHLCPSPLPVLSTALCTLGRVDRRWRTLTRLTVDVCRMHAPVLTLPHACTPAQSTPLIDGCRCVHVVPDMSKAQVGTETKPPWTMQSHSPGTHDGKCVAAGGDQP